MRCTITKKVTSTSLLFQEKRPKAERWRPFYLDKSNKIGYFLLKIDRNMATQEQIEVLKTDENAFELGEDTEQDFKRY